MKEIADTITKHPNEKHYLYSSFNAGGIRDMARVLEALGYSPLSMSGEAADEAARNDDRSRRPPLLAPPGGQEGVGRDVPRYLTKDGVDEIVMQEAEKRDGTRRFPDAGETPEHGDRTAA
eukprot:jgi/Mesvir1/23247/Mv03139-RA.1